MAFLLFSLALPIVFVLVVLIALPSSRGGGSSRNVARAATHNVTLERDLLEALRRSSLLAAGPFKLMLAENTHYRVNEPAHCRKCRRARRRYYGHCARYPYCTMERVRYRLAEKVKPCCHGVPIRALALNSEDPIAAFCAACGTVTMVTDDSEKAKLLSGIANLRSHLQLDAGKEVSPYR